LDGKQFSPIRHSPFESQVAPEKGAPQSKSLVQAQAPLVAPSLHWHGCPFEQVAPGPQLQVVAWVTITTVPHSNPAGQALPPEQSIPHQNLQFPPGLVQLASFRGSSRQRFFPLGPQSLFPLFGSQALQYGFPDEQALTQLWLVQFCSNRHPCVEVHLSTWHWPLMQP
jgi:hypothetical protein